MIAEIFKPPSIEWLVSPGMETRTLSDGHEIPLLGLGVWQVESGRECVDSVRRALELGYRYIDTAQAYGNRGERRESLTSR